MRDKIVTAVLGDDLYVKTSHVFQYDYGLTLMIEGIQLPAEYEIHFSNKKRGVAKKGELVQGGAKIPDEYLRSGDNVYAWVYIRHGDDDGYTVYSVEIPVVQRSVEQGDNITIIEHNIIDEAIAALEDAVEKTDQNVKNYPYINEENHHWMVYDAETGEFVDTGVRAEAVDIDPTELIDDTAGAGILDKSWSANKLTEEFGTKADKADTVLDTTLSRGRKSNTTVGDASFAFGYTVEASGNGSHAEGSYASATEFASHAEGANTVASGTYSHAEGSGSTASSVASHAEGNQSIASGYASHAEGINSRASGQFSHAENYNTKATGQMAHAEGNTTEAVGFASHTEGSGTIASGSQTHAEGTGSQAIGDYSHAEGFGTKAVGACSHVSGRLNIADSYDNWSEWAANTEYAVGDKVKRTVTNNNTTTVTGYVCKTANSDSEFISSKWSNQNGQMNHAEIVGNGANNNYSNAYALDWDGTGHFGGDVYVNCDPNSTGGTKLATVDDVPEVATLQETQAIIDEYETRVGV